MFDMSQFVAWRDIGPLLEPEIKNDNFVRLVEVVGCQLEG